MTQRPPMKVAAMDAELFYIRDSEEELYLACELAGLKALRRYDAITHTYQISFSVGDLDFVRELLGTPYDDLALLFYARYTTWLLRHP